MNEQIDREKLLDALRIDRPETVHSRRSQSGSIILRLGRVGVAAISVLAVALIAYVMWPKDVLTVQALTLEAPTTSSRASLNASGYVVARRQATLSAKILGKLTEVNVEEGERIEKGQIVARLDDTNFVAALRQAQAQERQASAALVQAKTAFDDARPSFSRYERLFQQGAISADAVDKERASYNAYRTAADVARMSLETAAAAVSVAQSNEDDTTVRAPFAGMVTNKAAQVGEIVAPAAAGGGFTRTGIATIVDMKSLEVQVDVSEDYIDRVRNDQKAIVKLNAYSDWEIPASVIAVIPTADLTKGTVTVRVRMVADDPRILPQMGAHVAFLIDDNASHLEKASANFELPANAVSVKGKVGTVYVIDDGSRLSKRSVKIMTISSQSVMISSGLQVGERVAIADFRKLRDGATVKVVE